MKPLFTRHSLLVSAIALAPLMAAQPAVAFDARSVALGGSIVADGRGVPGALANPSSMMRMNRRGQSIHLRIGAGSEIRDSGGLIEEISDDGNSDLFDDIDTELETLDGAEFTCINPITDTAETACVNGTQGLGEIAGRFLDLTNEFDGETISAQATGELGFAYTGGSTPIAVHILGRGTVAATPNISQDDQDYIGLFNTTLIDDELSLGEINDNSDRLSLDAETQTLVVAQPEESLNSTADASVLLRSQIGISLARSLSLIGVNIDFGITPKFSSLRASSNNFLINEEFADDQPTASDRFEQNEVEESSFTFDVGASASLFAFPLRLGAVLRNVIPESVKTEEDFEFETTPQLVVGGVFDLPLISINADLALNEAKVDNFETQLLAIGAEFTPLPLFALRAGISSDLASSETALSLGFGAGPIHFGARATALDALQVGIDVAFSF